MKLSILATAFAVWTSNVAAIAVTGAAEGFAKGTTGGGNASPVYPKSVRFTNFQCLQKSGADRLITIRTQSWSLIWVTLPLV
jgi:hypothetical protein